MPWSTAGRNARASANASTITTASMHSGDPGAAGTANEWSGGGYSRQSVNWGGPSNGVVSADPIDFTSPPATAAAWIALWDGSTFIASAQRTSGDAASNALGQYQVGTLSIDSTGTISA